jgi:diguanylate cyclase (GGDEF)-like protein
MGVPNLAEIYVANALGIVLMVGVLLNGAWKQQKKGEDVLILYIILSILVSCISDPICFTADGKPGTLAFVLVYGFNLLLYITMLVLSANWIVLLERHISGINRRWVIISVNVICGIAFLGLIVNFFVPFIFYVDENNVYSRGPLYNIYTLIGFIFIIMGSFLYYLARRKGGVFKAFPVLHFIIPIIVGVLVQTFNYGISAIWAFAAVGLMLFFLQLQKENIYTDKLTGLFNRFYLDKIQSEKKSKKDFCMIFVDINDFKGINDAFGHKEGDKVIKAVADIISAGIENRGIIVRYASDEFVIFLNTDSVIDSDSCVKSIRDNVALYNAEGESKCEISVSVGSGIFNFETSSILHALEVTESRMYEDKSEYYNKHERRS